MSAGAQIQRRHLQLRPVARRMSAKRLDASLAKYRPARCSTLLVGGGVVLSPCERPLCCLLCFRPESAILSTLWLMTSLSRHYLVPTDPRRHADVLSSLRHPQSSTLARVVQPVWTTTPNRVVVPESSPGSCQAVQSASRRLTAAQRVRGLGQTRCYSPPRRSRPPPLYRVVFPTPRALLFVCRNSIGIVTGQSSPKFMFQLQYILVTVIIINLVMACP